MPALKKSSETVLARNWRALLRRVKRPDVERAMLDLLRLPDRLAADRRAPEVDYRLAAEFLAALDPDAPLDDAVAGLLQATCLYRAGDAAAALERYEEARSRARDLAAGPKGRVLTTMCACGEALAAVRTRNRRLAARRARLALRTADIADTPWVNAYAKHTLARVLLIDTEHRKRARALAEEARLTYRSGPHRDLRGEAYCLHILGRLSSDEGDTQAGLALLHQGLALMRRSHAERGAASLLIEIGWLRSHQQSHAVARAHGREALEELDDCNDARGLAKAYHLIGWTFLKEGRLHEAHASFVRAHEYAETVNCASLQAACAYFLARSAFEMGHNDISREHLDPASDLAGFDPVIDHSVAGLEAALAIRGHRWSRGATLIRHLVSDLRALQIPRVEADALFLCGFELCRHGRAEQAAPLLSRALEVAETSQASGAVQAFLAAVEGLGLDRWLSALIRATEKRSRAAQALVDQRRAAAFGFHDLKNLAFSDLYSQLLLHQDDPEDHPLESIADKALATSQLAADLQQAFEHGRNLLKPRMEAFDLSRWVREQAEVSNIYAIAGITYRVHVEPDLPPAAADPRMVGAILLNLKNNAEKYAPGCTVTLSVKGRRNRRGDLVDLVFGFADDGPGIDPRDLEIIFGIGKSPDEYTSRRVDHGSGLGLGYCRVLVEGMGGRIWAESELGKGAAFYIELPVAKNKQAGQKGGDG